MTSSVTSSTPGKYFQPALTRTLSPGLSPLAKTGTVATPSLVATLTRDKTPETASR